MIQSSIQQYQTTLSPAQRLVLFIVIMLAAGSVFKSYHFVRDYGNIDLRARMVGARLLHTSESPYFFKWTPAYSDRLLMFKEVNENPRAANGVTQAPGFLYVEALFNNLPYRTLQWVWALCQYLLIGYIFYVFLFRLPGSLRDKFLPFVVGAFFFLSSAIWFITIERGQAYLVFAVVFCVIYQLYLKQKPLAYFAAGAVIAATAYCRPNFIIVLLPFLLAFNRWTIAGFIAAALPLGLHAWLHMDLWNDYNKAMAHYAAFKPIPPLASHAPFQYPAVVEGVPETLLSKRKVDFHVGGILPVMERLNAAFGPVNPRLSFVLYGLVVLLLLFGLRKKLQRKLPADLILCSFLLYMVSEYIMPVGRGAYTLVQWVFPVLLMLQQRRFRTKEIVLLIAGLCFITDIPTYLPFMNDIGELMLVVSVITFIRKDVAPKAEPVPG